MIRRAANRQWIPALLALAVALLLGLAGCGAQSAYIPEAVVILNPTPGVPSVYSAHVFPGGPGPFPPQRPHPKPPNPWPPGNCQVVHIVKPGDTVSRLALHYRVPAQAIIQVNQLRNPNLIFVGQGLCIPYPVTPTPGPTPTATDPGPVFPTATPIPPCGPFYIVQSGDTVEEIALRCRVSSRALILVNRIPPPYTLTPGQSLIIPGAS